MSDNMKPCPFCGGTTIVSMNDPENFGMRCYDCEAWGPRDEDVSWNKRPIEDELREQLHALVVRGWVVEKRLLYDEESVEGWAWIEPDGTEHIVVGEWGDLPPWPDMRSKEGTK